MPLLPVVLIIGVLLYEMMAKPSTLSGASSAASGARKTTTGAATNTAATGGVAGLINSLFGAKPATASGSAARPSVGGGGGSSIGATPTQTGFNQPSNQTVDYNNLQAYGTDANGNLVYIDPSGNVVDQSGTLVTNLSTITPLSTDVGTGTSLITQTAPGDGFSTPSPNLTNSNGTPDLSLLTGAGSGVPVLDTSGNQDVALAQDASATGDISSFDPSF